MRFRRFDDLRLFDVVARHGSFTAAAGELCLTKGAVSYRVAQLERELGFALFERARGGIALTAKGVQLWHASQAAFHGLERDIARLREDGRGRITVGMSTYFASRWLSPRLMSFTSAHPRTALRLQPLVDLLDLGAHGIDMAIRWGRGEWTDMRVEPLLPCAAFATAGRAVAARVATEGLETVLAEQTLLHDRDGSGAWREWHAAAGLPYRVGQDALVVPDPNVRVRAVIDGQGVALNDALVAEELASGELVAIADVELDAYGYFLAYPDEALENPDLAAFRDWLLGEADER